VSTRQGRSISEAEVMSRRKRYIIEGKGSGVGHVTAWKV